MTYGPTRKGMERLVVIVGVVFVGGTPAARSADGAQARYYTWPTQERDSYYQGTVYFPNGEKARFRVRRPTAIFPEGSEVVIVPYVAPGKSLPLRQGEGGELAPKEALLTKTPSEDEKKSPRKKPEKKKDEEIAFEPADLEPLEPAEDPAAAEPTGADVSATEQKGSWQVDLCEEAAGTVSLGMGSETLEAKGGLTDYSGDTPIMGTAFAGSCGFAQNWEVDLAVDKHNFVVREKRSRGGETNSKKDQSYDRLSTEFGGGYRIKLTDRIDVVPGGQVYYARMPLVYVDADDENSGELRTVSVITGGVQGRLNYRFVSGARVVFDLAYDALTSQDKATAWRVGLRYRAPVWENLHWQAGAQYKGETVAAANDCAENPSCETTSESRSRLFSASLGIGAHLVPERSSRQLSSVSKPPRHK